MTEKKNLSLRLSLNLSKLSFFRIPASVDPCSSNFSWYFLNFSMYLALLIPTPSAVVILRIWHIFSWQVSQSCFLFFFQNPIFIILNFLLKAFPLESVPLYIISFKTKPYTSGGYLSRLSSSWSSFCVCLFKNCINLLPLFLDQNHSKNCSSSIKSS